MSLEKRKQSHWPWGHPFIPADPQSSQNKEVESLKFRSNAQQFIDAEGQQEKGEPTAKYLKTNQKELR
jgi:hypothetical protein